MYWGRASVYTAQIPTHGPHSGGHVAPGVPPCVVPGVAPCVSPRGEAVAADAGDAAIAPPGRSCITTVGTRNSRIEPGLTAVGGRYRLLSATGEAHV